MAVFKVCAIAEQYCDLVVFLGWIVGVVILLSLYESHLAPNAFTMLLSMSMTPGPKLGITRASTGRVSLLRVDTKKICSKILRGDSLALRNDIAPCETGNTHVCRLVAR